MNTKFMKSKKYVIVALFVLAALLSVWLSDKVAINYNISDYLDESTETKISLNIIEDEFGKTGDVQVMIENIDTESAKDVVDTIKKIPNVLTVNFDEYDTNYYKDGDALFVVLVDGDEYSDTANAVVEDIRTALDDSFEGKINYGGSVVEKRTMREAIQNEIVLILAIAVCLVIAIMLIMAKSWIEPIILLIASGVAILINMGTNAIFGEISYITNAVAAILQLALSIDYSIVLLHGYRKAKENDVSSEKAMTSAIKDVIKPVSASALTTIAGLLALLFMTMRIGFDIGIVLMKGIIISALTSMTLLPALLLIFEKLMDKTAKRELVLKDKKLCSFAVKGSKAVVPIALALIIACGVLQFGNAYSFTDSKGSNTAIEDVFGSNNSVVVVYPNSNGSFDKESELADKLLTFKTADGKTVLKNYTAYSNTVRELYDIDMAARKLDIGLGLLLHGGSLCLRGADERLGLRAGIVHGALRDGLGLGVGCEQMRFVIALGGLRVELGLVGLVIDRIDLSLPLGKDILDGLEQEALEQVKLNEQVQNLGDERPAIKGDQRLIVQSCSLLSERSFPELTACQGTGWARRRSEAGP